MKGEGGKNDALPKTNPIDEKENEKKPKKKVAIKPSPASVYICRVFLLHALSVGAEVRIHICLGYISKQKNT